MGQRRNMAFALAILILAAAVAWALQLAAPVPDTDQPRTQTQRPGTPLEGGLQNPERNVVAQPSGDRDIIPSREDLLQGIVVTGEGEPIGGAEVQLQRREGQGFAMVEKGDYGHAEVLARTHTASDGTFSFTVSPLHQLALAAEAEGYGPEMVFACYGGQFHRVVLQQACAIEGLVTSAEDHSPMEGVQIWVFKANLVPTLSEVVAGATLADPGRRLREPKCGTIPGPCAACAPTNRAPS